MTTFQFTDKWFVSITSAIFLTLFTFAVGTQMGWITSIDHLEVAAAFTSYVCTILCNYQSRWNYPFGIVSQALIFWVLWNSGSPALAVFNLYLVFSLLYGYVFWKSDAITVPVKRIKSTKAYSGYALFGLGILALYYAAIYLIEPQTPISKFDAIIAAMSGVAQLMLDRKRIETWVVWFVVNVITIPYMFYHELYFFAFQYLFFLGNTFIGYASWKKTMED